MVEVESHRTAEFPVPASRIWELIADFGGIGEWWPQGMLTRIEVEGEGIGMVRHMHTVVGLVLSERLDGLDPSERRIDLSITGDLPGGISSYAAFGRVVEVAADRCRLEWTGRYRVPSREDEVGARAFLEGAYEMQARGLLEHVTSRTAEDDPTSS
jgi:hypothetical protein